MTRGPVVPDAEVHQDVNSDPLIVPIASHLSRSNVSLPDETLLGQGLWQEQPEQDTLTRTMRKWGAVVLLTALVGWVARS